MASLERSFGATPGQPTQLQVLTAMASVVAGLTLLWSLADARLIDGEAVWLKPLKFSVSFVVFFGTFALLEPRLSRGVREGWVFRVTCLIMTAAFLGEIAYILYQGARAEPSHYNYSTPFHTVMYTVFMAAGATLLVLATAVIGGLVWRDAGADLRPGVREGVIVGFVLTCVLTLIVAGQMAGQASHHVGVHPDGGPTVPFFEWSGVVGDYRPAHFLSLHAMQVLPLIGLLLDRARPAAAVSWVRIMAVAYSAVTLAVFLQALAGRPFIPLV